jgi:hypothetical protein
VVDVVAACLKAAAAFSVGAAAAAEARLMGMGPTWLSDIPTTCWLGEGFVVAAADEAPAAIGDTAATMSTAIARRRCCWA